jgi:hypothetical protein
MDLTDALELLASTTKSAVVLAVSQCGEVDVDEGGTARGHRACERKDKASL